MTKAGCGTVASHAVRAVSNRGGVNDRTVVGEARTSIGRALGRFMHRSIVEPIVRRRPTSILAEVRAALARPASGVLIACAALLAGCGDGPGTAEAPFRPPHAFEGPPKRARAGQGGPAAESVDDTAAELRFRALVAVWETAGDDAAANDRAIAAILATGPEGAARLVRWLADGDPNQRDSAMTLIPLLGEAAVPALTEMAAGTSDARSLAVSLLDDLVPVWRGSALGPDVCRALVTCLDGPDSRNAGNALKRARPAVAAVVPELVERWRATWTDDAASDGGAVEILIAAGTDARAAVEAAIDSFESGDPERRVDGSRILAAIGATTPTHLARLTAMLTDAPPNDSAWDQRALALEVIASWGDAAASAAPRIAALLDRDQPQHVRIAAAEALASMPGTSPRWTAQLASLAWADDDDSRITYVLSHSVLSRLDPESLAEVIPELPMDRVENAMNWIDARAESAPDAPRRVVLTSAADVARARLAASPDAEARLRAIASCLRVGPPTDTPAWLVALLDDDDVRVRAATTHALSQVGAVDPARILAVAAPITRDPEWFGWAIAALGALAERDAPALATLVAVLDDASLGDRTRDSAAQALGKGTAPISGGHPEAIAFLTRDVLESPHPESATRALLRFDGGAAAFVARIRREFGPPPRTVDSATQDQILRALAAAGPRAEPLRDALIAWGGDGARHGLDALRGGGASILRIGDGDEATFRRLIAATPDARAWVVALAANLDWPLPDWLGPAVASAGIEAEVLAAAEARIDGIPAKTQTEGALVLAPFLAPHPAAAALIAVVRSDPPKFADAVWELTPVARRDPSAVSPEFVASLFLEIEEHDNVRDRVYALADALGRRGAPLVPILRERRRIDRPLDSVWSAIVLFHATGDAEEAMSAIRPILERPDRASIFVPWEAVGDVLTTATLSKPDRTLLLGALPRATFPQSRAAIVRGLGPLGADAAPLVPSLRAILSQEFGGAAGSDDEIELGIATCRALGGLGVAARSALPDLRRWIALTIDHDGTTDAGEAAIRAIESATR